MGPIVLVDLNTIITSVHHIDPTIIGKGDTPGITHSSRPTSTRCNGSFIISNGVFKHDHTVVGRIADIKRIQVISKIRGTT